MPFWTNDICTVKTNMTSYKFTRSSRGHFEILDDFVITETLVALVLRYIKGETALYAVKSVCTWMYRSMHLHKGTAESMLRGNQRKLEVQDAGLETVETNHRITLKFHLHFSLAMLLVNNVREQTARKIRI